MVEFALVAVLLVFLLFAVLQVAVYFYVRTIVAAAAADGARYGSSAGVDDAAGGRRAQDEIGGAVFAGQGVTCTGARAVDAASGLAVTRVTCHGHLRSVFAPVGGLIAVGATAASLKEGA